MRIGQRAAILISIVQAVTWAACQEPPSDSGPAATAVASPRQRPYLRFVEGSHARAGAAGRSKLEATLGGVTRPVVAKSRRVILQPCGPPGERRASGAALTSPCVLDLPRLPGAQWLLVEPVRSLGYLRAARRLEDHLGGPLPERRPRIVPAAPLPGTSPLEVPSYESRGLAAHAVPPLAQRRIDTEAFWVPTGATLRFAIATEAGAQQVDSAPVDFVVYGLPGRRSGPTGDAIELFRRSIDPARHPDERGWMEHEVSLAPLGGESAHLRFETMPTDPTDRRPQLPLWGDPTVLAPAPPDDRRPFVVLVSLDTLRARSLSAYGREIETSPFFDALAAQGTLFERAFTTYSNTLGSHMSMLTGLWPRTHGVFESQALGREHPTLAESMRAAGYETAAFTEDGLLNRLSGFSRGFGLYSENDEVGAGAGLAAETFGAGLDWARRHAATPFFLFLHTYQVHAPYEPAAPYSELFASYGEITGLRRYEQEIRYLDDQLRHLVRGLDQILGARNLLLVVTADHGEEFLEHGAVVHTQLFDEVMHVPLLFRWPGTIPAGQRIDAAVSLVDVTPTVLDLAGVPEPRGDDGTSLRSVLLGESRPTRRTVFGESPPRLRGKVPRRFVGRTDRYKCILREGSTDGVCYDLSKDPNEASPLPSELAPDAQTLLDEVRRYRDGAPQEPTLQKKARSESVEIDPKKEHKLRALGYVE